MPRRPAGTAVPEVLTMTGKHQLLTSENTTAGNIGFAVASGAYFVQTNIGGVERATTTEQAVFGNLDPTIGG